MRGLARDVAVFEEAFGDDVYNGISMENDAGDEAKTSTAWSELLLAAASFSMLAGRHRLFNQQHQYEQLALHW